MKGFHIINLLFYFFLASQIFGQETVFKKGELVDSISIPGTKETFALYLPSSYDPTSLSSIIFVFDPAARGSVGLGNFIDASEKFNHILVASNDTRNYVDSNFDVINRLFDHIFKSFNINEDLVYTAGFSGGSRLATSVAVLTNSMAGVIACGAGMPSNFNEIPNKTHSFSYVALIGELDMNYQELFSTHRFLSKIPLDNELFIATYNHEWPSSNEIIKAVSWLELQAYKLFKKKKDPDFIKATYINWYNDIKDYNNSNKIEFTVLAYERLIRNFSKYYKLDSISTKIEQLKQSKKYKLNKKQITEIAKIETNLQRTFYDRFTKELNQNKLPKNFKWWEKEFEKLKISTQNNKSSLKLESNYRLERMLFALAIETTYTIDFDKEPKKVIYCHKLISYIMPTNPLPFYLLAKDYASLDDKSHLLTYLKIAIKNGWSDRETILNTPEFSNYLLDTDFLLIINGL